MRGRDIAAVIERDLLRADDEKGSDDHTNTRSQLRVGGLLTPLFQALRIATLRRPDLLFDDILTPYNLLLHFRSNENYTRTQTGVTERSPFNTRYDTQKIIASDPTD
jgi:hypothetical protein